MALGEELQADVEEVLDLVDKILALDWLPVQKLDITTRLLIAIASRQCNMRDNEKRN